MLAGVGVALKLVQALLTGDRAAGRAAAAFREDRRDRHAGRRGAARRREPRHRRAASQGCRPGRTAPGLEALLDESGLLGEALDSFHVGFVLAPQAERRRAHELARPRRSICCLLRGRDDEVRDARAGPGAPVVRGEHEAAGAGGRDSRRGAAVDRAATRRSARRTCSSWPARAGIAASSASSRRSSSRRTDKPALVLSIENGVARGSGRSIPAFDLLAGLESARTSSCSSAGTSRRPA